MVYLGMGILPEREVMEALAEEAGMSKEDVAELYEGQATEDSTKRPRQPSLTVRASHLSLHTDEPKPGAQTEVTAAGYARQPFPPTETS